jgi:hypothetical protein
LRPGHQRQQVITPGILEQSNQSLQKGNSRTQHPAGGQHLLTQQPPAAAAAAATSISSCPGAAAHSRTQQDPQQGSTQQTKTHNKTASANNISLMISLA